MSVRRQLQAVVATAALVGACGTHRGAWQSVQDTPSLDDNRAAVSLVVVGGAGAPTRWADTVGTELDARLTAEHDGGRTPIVLWLGDQSLPRHPETRRASCPQDPALSSRSGPATIAAAVQRHVERGHQSYAIAGVADWACGVESSLQQATPDAGPNPWTMPALNYVVRVATDGSSRVVSRCPSASQCSVDPAPQQGEPEALIDLVFVDLAPWIAADRIAPYPSVPRHGPRARTQAARRGATSPRRAALDQAVAQLEALVDAVTQSSEASPPRVLVSAVPVEGAGYEGMGGGGSVASFHTLPVRLQEAVRSGVFAGALGAQDRAVYAQADITDATKRSSRAWLAAPMFQVVSGAASLPDRRFGGTPRRLRYYRSNAYQATAYSDGPGFAVVDVHPDRVAAQLYTHRRRRWERTQVQAPLVPGRHPPETASPPLSPCLRCETIPVNER